MAVDSPAAPGAPAPGASQPGPPGHPESSVKETVESILVAFILAFIFRAFVVEAFVIPTGSMAPTLMGAHVRFRCEDCGYRWAVNYSSGSRNPGDDINIPAHGRDLPSPVYCPNCGFPVPKGDVRDGDNDARRPSVHYGDRILVLKYLYLFQEPRRWDVVVFKSPSEMPTVTIDGVDGDRRAKPDPRQPRYAENYIKRLVGRPGETVAILDGDVYVYVPPPGEAPATVGGGGGGDGEVDLASLDWSKFEVQRKPDVVQDALWRNVYDNDYLPHLPAEQRSPAWEQPWKPAGGSGWVRGAGGDADDGVGRSRVFRFDNAAGAGELAFDRSVNAQVHPLTDHTAYDQLEEYRRHNQPMPVSDLKLACTYTRRSGEGPLRLTLVKRSDAFTAEVLPGRVQLLRSTGDDAAPAPVGPPVDVPGLRAGAPAALEFANVDYRVSLRVNGREVLATTPEQYRPDVDALRRMGRSDPPPGAARIGAEGQQCELEHVALARDVYYLNGWNRSGMGQDLAGSPDRPITMGPDEFFVLGDNALISGDARTWTERVHLPDQDLEVAPGRVPRRFLLGKAFFVYWPAGYRPMEGAPGLIPNFGQIRFIH